MNCVVHLQWASDRSDESLEKRRVQRRKKISRRLPNKPRKVSRKNRRLKTKVPSRTAPPTVPTTTTTTTTQLALATTQLVTNTVSIATSMIDRIIPNSTTVLPVVIVEKVTSTTEKTTTTIPPPVKANCTMMDEVVSTTMNAVTTAMQMFHDGEPTEAAALKREEPDWDYYDVIDDDEAADVVDYSSTVPFVTSTELPVTVMPIDELDDTIIVTKQQAIVCATAFLVFLAAFAACICCWAKRLNARCCRVPRRPHMTISPREESDDVTVTEELESESTYDEIRFTHENETETVYDTVADEKENNASDQPGPSQEFGATECTNDTEPADRQPLYAPGYLFRTEEETICRNLLSLAFKDKNERLAMTTSELAEYSVSREMLLQHNLFDLFHHVEAVKKMTSKVASHIKRNFYGTLQSATIQTRLIAVTWASKDLAQYIYTVTPYMQAIDCSERLIPQLAGVIHGWVMHEVAEHEKRLGVFQPPELPESKPLLKQENEPVSVLKKDRPLSSQFQQRAKALADAMRGNNRDTD